MVKVIIADNGTAIGREESKTLFEPTEKSNCKRKLILKNCFKLYIIKLGM